LPGSSEGVADGGVAFSSLPIDTGGGTTAANGGIKTAQKAPVVNGGGENGLVLAIDTQDDMEDFEDLSETAALTQTTIS